MIKNSKKSDSKNAIHNTQYTRRGKVSTVTLRVSEAQSKDVGRGIARTDPADMAALGASIGDVVEVRSKEQNAVAKLMPIYMEDRGKKIIQIDGILRDNAKVGIDEKVEVLKVVHHEASRVVLKPLQAASLRGDEQYLGKLFAGIPVIKGSKVRALLFGSKSRDFEVMDVSPSGVVLVSPQTAIVIKGTEREEAAVEGKPGVSYEDIGGLDKEIQRVREMVELPLKYPQVFDRLGIDPPKGVLLYGPPGTGKTLIARAVAHEADANFFTVNGPEVIHKFYGESLPGDELLLVLKDGYLKRMPIAEVVAEKNPRLQVPCFNSEGKLQFGKVTAFFEHPFKGRLLRVRTATGRSIRVTDDHSLFTINEKGIQSVPTSHLEVSRSFIAIPKQLPLAPQPIDKINLLPLLKDDSDVVLRGQHIDQIMCQSKEILGVERCSQLLGFSERYVNENLGKNIGIRAPDLFKLAEAANLEIEAERVILSTIKRTDGMSAILELNEYICHLFGWWLAEGSYIHNGGVRISLNSSEAGHVESICRRLFGDLTLYRKRDADSVDIIINSSVLVRAMRALGFTSGSHNKRVPDFVYSLSMGNIAALLRGYFSGDGSVNSVTPTPQIETSTVSEELADGVCYLLLYFGIVAKIYDRPSEQSKRICFADSKNLERFLEIGFVDPDRNAIIRRYLANNPASRRDKIPLEIIRDQLGWRGDAWGGLTGIGIEAVKKNAKSLPAPLLIALNGDIFWDKVVSIEELPEKPAFVYDIAVEPGENFIAGFGGIFAHNSEKHLREYFEKAADAAPSILFIDEIDAIAPKRTEVQGEVEKRVVATLLSQMDGLKGRGNVIVIGATNIPDMLDPALRRPGRFDREIRIGIPDRCGREQILNIHTRGMPLAQDVDIKRIAEITHGYVGADLEALARESAMSCLRRLFVGSNISLDEIPLDKLMELEVTMGHFMEAMSEVEPSAIREVFVEVPNVTWEDVGGLDDIKERLKESVQWPLTYTGLFEHMHVSPPRGILLEGAPGTGKTLIAKALANESGVNFISIKGPELMNKYVGEAEKGVRELFKTAKAASPCIIFFDEIDSIVPERGHAGGDSGVSQRVISQFLTEMDGIEELKGVMVLGATNRKDLIDTALLRTGRFDFILSVGMPDAKTRGEIFDIHTRGKPLDSKMDTTILVEKTEGMSGSDIEAVCRRAAMNVMRKFIHEYKDSADRKKKLLKITTGDFEQALEEVKKERIAFSV